MIITGKYPKLRMRRLRKEDWSRRLVRENTLSGSDFVLPIFITEGKNKKIQIVFDATSAQSHKEHLHILQTLNALIIDLTPAKTGVLCIPDINLNEALKSQNVNMVT